MTKDKHGDHSYIGQKIKILTRMKKDLKHPPEVFDQKTAPSIFAIFTGKYICWSLFFNKFAGLLRPATLLQNRIWYRDCEICKNTYFEEHLRTAFSGESCQFFKRNFILHDTLPDKLLVFYHPWQITSFSF